MRTHFLLSRILVKKSSNLEEKCDQSATAGNPHFVLGEISTPKPKKNRKVREECGRTGKQCGRTQHLESNSEQKMKRVRPQCGRTWAAFSLKTAILRIFYFRRIRPRLKRWKIEGGNMGTRWDKFRVIPHVHMLQIHYKKRGISSPWGITILREKFTR